MKCKEEVDSLTIGGDEIRDTCNTEMTEIGEITAYKKENEFAKPNHARFFQCGNCKTVKLV